MKKDSFFLWIQAFALCVVSCRCCFPERRLRYALANPEGDESGQDSDKKDHSPVGVAQDDARHQRSESIADGPGTLHQRNRLGAQFIGPGFRDQGRACIPLASHAQSEDEAKHRQHKHGSRESGRERADRVSQDAEHEGALASDAVGKKAEEHTADARGQQSESVEKAGRPLRHAEIAHDVGQHQRVKHGVEGVEHPAESGGQQGAALGGSGLLQELHGAGGHAESEYIRRADGKKNRCRTWVDWIYLHGADSNHLYSNRVFLVLCIVLVEVFVE